MLMGKIRTWVKVTSVKVPGKCEFWINKNEL